nr:reverse transcriptase domain-containing protein [Tanacetum cinerariifolium]
NYNQGNTSYRPLMMSNQIRPPGFPPVPNNQNIQLNQRNNQIRFIQNQNRGSNFNQGPVYQPLVFQPPAYQAPAPQTQGVSKEDFSAYVKANDVVMRNMQTQGQNMQNQLTNLTELITKFVNSNSATTSSSGTLPSNKIANPRSDLKAITTRSGVSYDGPQIPPSTSFLPKVVENEPEATKDTVQPTNNGSTKDVQPPVVQSESLILNSKPVTSPISEPVIAPKANNQIEKFYEIFKDMSFEISFADALILMPKFSSTLKALIGNKEKLSEMAQTLLNEHCSAVLLKELPKKLGNPGKLYLPDLTPTYMTLELADRLISRPVGVAEDVYVKVGSFYFLADFVVVNFDADPRVPLILWRSFLKTERALIDVFEGELTLRVGKEAITFNLDQTSGYSASYSDMTAKRIDVVDMACEEYSQKVLSFSDVITKVNAFLAIKDDPTLPAVDQSYLDLEGDILLLEAFLNDDPSLPPPTQGNYLPEVHKELKICDDKLPVIITKDLSVEEKTALITVLKSHNPLVSPVHCVPKKGGFTVVENEDNELIPTRLVTGWCVCIDYRKLNEATRKDHFPLPFMDQMLERLAGNKYYCFLDGFFGYFQIPIDLKDQEKTIFTCPYGTFACFRMPFGLCNAPGTFQRCMMAIFHDMIEKIMEVFMDDFSVFGNSFQSYLSHLERMLKRYEDTNLCLNWEKTHFMVKEGIVIGHKIFKQGIEVDKAKVDVITKLPHTTTVKECVEAFQTLKRKLTEAPILIAPDWDMPFELMFDASDFAIGAVLGQRQDKHFRPIHYAKSKERLLCWVLHLQEFTFKVIDTKGAKNIAADHLSRLENPHQNVLDPKEINESFPLETLNLVSTRGNQSTPWFADFANYHAGNFVVKGMSSQQKKHKAYWALKHANFDLKTAGDHMKVQINELRDQAYENSLIYKEKTKRLHDSKIKDRVLSSTTESSSLTPI